MSAAFVIAPACQSLRFTSFVDRGASLSKQPLFGHALSRASFQQPGERRRSFHIVCAFTPADVTSVFVAGATGETGRRVVKALLEKGVKVRAGVRNPEEAPGVVPEGADIIKADVKDKKLLAGALGDANVVICASGVNYRKGETKNPLGPYSVDWLGTRNLVDVAKEKGVKHFVLVTSLCVSKFFHPLNLFFLILFWKKRAEEYLMNSGVTYTIIRPGGLINDDDLPNPIVASKADTLFTGRIPRTKVAQMAVEAVFDDNSRNKIVEIITEPDAPVKTPAELFASV
mmetsp:Transcript_4677/g.7242  ORF Transcript_4677/g.7242 Transcript_4677/m.7242 type:complete len:286 (-) Transcript_4677:107-964(-)|eukprot:CAMPEP_0184644396 /NCGR_PEP_ID=MMETSP0308-20130426/1118_1 /TAXON_ID=38269 /ORGANISM="Gloeochaete witrockiana, Strain SAG 46.84" /LENGTH=285 /DNA_ID=CAMNT_0027072901 /DNA_START=93 /DNA_END=950 /DNA_ORIENTATION=+